jgi:hypothetical protein
MQETFIGYLWLFGNDYFFGLKVSFYTKDLTLSVSKIFDKMFFGFKIPNKNFPCSKNILNV